MGQRLIDDWYSDGELKNNQYVFEGQEHRREQSPSIYLADMVESMTYLEDLICSVPELWLRLNYLSFEPKIIIPIGQTG